MKILKNIKTSKFLLFEKIKNQGAWPTLVLVCPLLYYRYHCYKLEELQLCFASKIKEFLTVNKQENLLAGVLVVVLLLAASD
jgi:hypothetical protein